MSECWREGCHRKTVGRLCHQHNHQNHLRYDLINQGNNRYTVNAWGEKPREVDPVERSHIRILKREIRSLENQPTPTPERCIGAVSGLWSTLKQVCGKLSEPAHRNKHGGKAEN